MTTTALVATDNTTWRHGNGFPGGYTSRCSGTSPAPGSNTSRSPRRQDRSLTQQLSSRTPRAGTPEPQRPLCLRVSKHTSARPGASHWRVPVAYRKLRVLCASVVPGLLQQVPHQLRLARQEHHRRPRGRPQPPELRVRHRHLVELLKLGQRVKLRHDRDAARVPRNG